MFYSFTSAELFFTENRFFSPRSKMPLNIKALSKKVGNELLGTENCAKLAPNQYFLPTVSDILHHFVHLQLSPDPPDADDMLRF